MTKDEHTSDSLLLEFETYLKKKNLAANTCTAYRITLRQYFEVFQTLSLENLQAYRSYLIDGYMPSTVNQRVHAINHFLRFLKECAPDTYPELNEYHMNALKKPRSSFQDFVISNEDCLFLERQLKQDGHIFWYFVVRFLVTTGVRVSELTRIKVEHLRCGYLDLYSKGGKHRRIYITDALCSETLAWCNSTGRNTGFLFSSRRGRPITPRWVHSRLTTFAAQYGIDPATAYPHSFRHRFAKNFLTRSGDIALLADLLGHESIETTRIYLMKSSKEQKTLLDELVTW